MSKFLQFKQKASIHHACASYLSCSSTKDGLLRYIPNTYSIHKVSSLKFAYFQGRLSRHITSPSEKTRLESWPGDYMGTATPFRQLSLSPTLATKCNERPSRATANPVGGKVCSSTKDGLLRYIPNTYSIHKVSSLKFAYFQERLSRHNTGKLLEFLKVQIAPLS